jgi:Spy/CpxP family protein refolding chaperone
MNPKTRLWFGIFVFLVFIAGGATGSLLERVFNRSWPGPMMGAVRVEGGNEAFVVGGPPGLPGRPGFAVTGPAPGMLAGVFADELKLTDPQRKQIETIFESHRPQLTELRESVREKFEQERKAIDAEIEKVLTPEQRDRFHEINARMRSRPFPPGAFPGRPF